MIDKTKPAFPIVGTHEQVLELGLTMRDYFAAKELSKICYALVGASDIEMDRQARHCYKMADAMLKAREP